MVRLAIKQAIEYWEQSRDIAGTVARLIAPISKYQPFREANHRTAHTLAATFLAANGFGWLSPPDDKELERLLEKDAKDPLWPLSTVVAEVTRLYANRQWYDYGVGYADADAEDETSLQDNHAGHNPREPNDPDQGTLFRFRVGVREVPAPDHRPSRRSKAGNQRAGRTAEGEEVEVGERPATP